MMRYKKHFLILMLIIITGLAGVAIFNYCIDPAGLFRLSRYEKGIAELLNSNQNVANLTNYDERLVQKYIVANSSENHDILVLGSSRTMQIHEGLFPHKNFLNCSVSGATIEDDIAIYELYRERARIPQKIIIGLDPWILNRNNEQTRWKSLSGEYQKASIRLGLSRSKNVFADNLNSRRYIELLSLPYLEASYKLFKESKNQNKNISYFPTSEKVLSVPVKLIDGTLSYPDNLQNISVEEAKKEAIKLADSSPIYSIGNFNKLDEDNMLKFEKFIIDLQQQNIEVTFFLPPYHPISYTKLVNNSRYKMVLEAQAYFISFANSHCISVIGSYSPYECNLTETDFYDGMHPKREAIDKMFSRGIAGL